MFSLTKRPLHVLSNKLHRYLARRRRPIEWMKEKWIADFSKSERSCFIIKPEISFSANLEKSFSSRQAALFLGLKKNNCMAWLETEHRVYVDQIIDARFRFDNLGGYCAVGIMFRAAEQGTYYLALISSKGYFRLDAVNNNIPRPLIGWTEAGLLGSDVHLKVIAQGDHLIFFINGKWLAEAYDDSIPGGHLGFALVSYDSDFENIGARYACQAWLNFLSVDSRVAAVKAEYQKWNDSAEISAESRFRLARSLAALNYFGAAYNQILKAWEQREELARSVTATYTEMRTKGELIFAARMASQLERYAAAEEYINACLAMGAEIPSLYALLGHACWNLNNYQAAAAAWDKALSLDQSNSLYAANAASAFEKMGKNDEALQRYLTGARCALQRKDYAALETFVPQLLTLGKNNREAQELAKKCERKVKPATARKTAVKKPVKKVVKKPAATAKTKTGAVKKPAAKSKGKAKPVAAQKTAAKTKGKTAKPKKKTKAS